jgi:hypothetical protein
MPFHHKGGGSPAPKRMKEDEKEKGKGQGKKAAVAKTVDSPQPATTTAKKGAATVNKAMTAGTERKGEAAARNAPSEAPSSTPPLPSSSATNVASKKLDAVSAESEKNSKQPATKKKTTTTTKVVKKLVAKPVTPQIDPAFVREKERFFAHFRTKVEALIDSHAPLKSVTGRTYEVNAKGLSSSSLLLERTLSRRAEDY